MIRSQVIISLKPFPRQFNHKRTFNFPCLRSLILTLRMFEESGRSQESA